MHRIATALAASIIAMSSAAEAKQLAFEARRDGASLRFAYAYLDHDGATRRTRFAAPQAAIAEAVRAFQAIDRAAMARAWNKERDGRVAAALTTLAARFPDAEFEVEGASVRYRLSPAAFNRTHRAATRRDLEIAVKVLQERFPRFDIALSAEGRIGARGPKAEMTTFRKALDAAMSQVEANAKARADAFAERQSAGEDALTSDLEAAMAELEADLERWRGAYYAARGYRIVGEALLPDYARFADDAADALAPLARAATIDATETRARLNALLAFFQTIPYDTLLSRSAAAGPGFAPPLALLAANRGDCDTKSVAFAAAARTAAPDVALVMVVLKDHALLGAAIPPQPGDATLDHEGRTYVLFEPVGPALSPVGRIAPRSAANLETRIDVTPL